MKIVIVLLAVIFITSSFTGPVKAELFDRGNGLIYDTVLDITWLQNANYTGGTMSWDSAMNWADSLIFREYNDWRLPATYSSCSGNTCWESEMDYLYYVEGITSTTPGPFSDVKSFMYWSETEDASNPANAWRFSFKYGTLDVSTKTSTRYAWAVRNGDSPPPIVPEPAGFVLFIAGGVLLAAGRFRKKQGPTGPCTTRA